MATFALTHRKSARVANSKMELFPPYLCLFLFWTFSLSLGFLSPIYSLLLWSPNVVIRKLPRNFLFLIEIQISCKFYKLDHSVHSFTIRLLLSVTILIFCFLFRNYLFYFSFKFSFCFLC